MKPAKFDPKNLDKLNQPERYKAIPPDLLRDTLGITESGTIVDIGAGTGYFAIPLARYLKNGRVFACDISEDMVSWMENNVRPLYVNIIPLMMKENNVPMEAETADGVQMINLYHELDHPDSMLLEVLRLLKAQGKVVIVDWKKQKTPHGPPIATRKTTQEVQEQLIRAGFVDVTVDDSLTQHFILSGRKGRKSCRKGE